MSSNITVVGNLVSDPELRFTPSGVAVARIGVAVNRRWQKDGEWQEHTSFFNGSVWREQAESVAESLQKGARVIITGRLEQRKWQDKDGNDRYDVEIQIDEIGPSLRWATATVNKTARSGGEYGGQQSADVPPAPVARESYGPDEAPF